MPLKLRLSLLYVGAFVFITAIMLTYIYLSYADFREEEFYERLKTKAENTGKLLFKVQEVDNALLKIIDRNTINQLYNEKVLVFDSLGSLVYSSLDDETIYYDKALLDEVDKRGYLELKNNEGDEIVGLKYMSKNKPYIVLVSSYDTTGKRKLSNLYIKIVIAFSIGSILIFLSSFLYIKQVFKPVENLNNTITDITQHGLQKRVNINEDATDELSNIAKNFNLMMDQLEQAFAMQNTFVQHTSHELKTPLSLIAADIEKIIARQQPSSPGMAELEGIRDITLAQAKMIDELLLLQKLKVNRRQGFKITRIDELVFDEIEYGKQLYGHNFQIEVNFDNSMQHEAALEREVNPVLLKTAFRNLLENAYFYSTNHLTYINFSEQSNKLLVTFSNRGTEMLPADMIFQPFYRHPNEKKIKGYGLGLALTQQILHYHQGNITYSWVDGMHNFTLTL
jgi:signal transduction histidine kinase